MPKSYSEETKAAALADLLTGNARRFVAAKYDVPVRTLRSWAAKARSDTTVATVDPPRSRGEVLGDEMYELVRLNIKALGAIDGMACDKSWLKKQDAHGLAVFAGVLSDKTHRILAAFQAGAREEA
jgi:hypothetical protein